MQEKWVHKIESMKKDFQRDKEFCKRKKYGDNITIDENRITEREPIHKENNYNMNTTETKEKRNPNETGTAKLTRIEKRKITT